MSAHLLELLTAERTRVIAEMARLAEQDPPGHGSWNGYLADLHGAISAIETEAAQ
jgi:hypothetical protein